MHLKRVFTRLFVLLIVYFILKNTVFNYYVSMHNSNALSKIEEVNEENYERFDMFIKEVEAKTDWKVYITSTYRTNEEQARLKKLDARNASPGQSKHNHAKAIDIVLYQNRGFWQKWIIKSSKKERWAATGILDIAKIHNLRWGGTFKNYYDPVHFEVD